MVYRVQKRGGAQHGAVSTENERGVKGFERSNDRTQQAGPDRPLHGASSADWTLDRSSGGSGVSERGRRADLSLFSYPAGGGWGKVFTLQSA